MLLAVSLSKDLQNSTNVFVVSLSISDFISSVALPFQGISVLSESGWPFGKGMCDLLGTIFIWSNPTSILTLTAIAVNRYIIITKGKREQQKIYTHRGNAFMVALLWLFPFLVVVMPQLIPATGGIVYDPNFRSCLWDLDHPLAIVFQSIASVIFTTVASSSYSSATLQSTALSGDMSSKQAAGCENLDAIWQSMTEPTRSHRGRVQASNRSISPKIWLLLW